MIKFYSVWIFLVLELQLQTFVMASLEVSPNETFPVAKLNDTWSHICRGDAPVTWNIDSVVKDSTTWGKIRVVHQNSPVSGNYSATITISNVDENDAMKALRCQYQDPSKTDNRTVYLSVDEDAILFVPTPTPVVHAQKNMPATLPCIPTSKFVTVKLFLHSSDEESIVDGVNITYDITKGFTINSVTLREAGQQVCEATRGSVKQSLFPYIIITEALEKIPRINYSSAQSVRVGEDFTLNCSISFAKDRNYYYKLDWKRPATATTNASTKHIYAEPNSAPRIVSVMLSVTNATKQDAGEYVCTMESFSFQANSSHYLNIYDESEEFLNVTTIESSITETAGKTAKWIIHIHSVPAVQKMEWLDKQRGKATRNKRFNINRTSNEEVVLSISDVGLEDDSPYEFIVTNGAINKSLALNLTVEGEPSVKISTNSDNVYGDFFHAGANVTFLCQAKGFPYPETLWELEKCKQEIGGGSESCTSVTLGQGLRETYSENGKGTISHLTIEITSNGYIHCHANNTQSNGTYEKEIQVIDFASPTKTGFDLLGDPEPIERTNVVLTCAARKLNFKKDTKWYKRQQDGSWVPLNSAVTEETPWSYKSHLKIENVNESRSGNYSCTVSNLSTGDEHRRHLAVQVQKITPPQFTKETNLDNKTVTYGRGDNIPVLVCGATGKPTPNITWFLNGVPIESKSQLVSLNNRTIANQSQMKIPSKVEYQGIYTCKASNGLTSEVHREIKVEGDFWWVIAAALSLVVVFLILLLLFKICKDKKEQLKLMQMLQDELIKGAPGDINPELPVHEQVNLLPYYETYEIPRDKILLGMLLGQGAFGKVHRAEVEFPGRGSITAAVKMVKANTNQSHLEALAKELKILVHLGKHVNVVNLVGACTKNYARKKELLVIVEYCRYGNLLKYLHRHRRDFKNQLNSTTGKIDPAYYASRSSMSPTQKLNYAALTFAHSQTAKPDSARYLKMDQVPHMPDITMQVSLNPSNNYLTGSNAGSANTEMSFVSDDAAGTDGRRMSTDSAYMNYRGDYQSQEVEPITTTNLVCWAFQIATGMDYLARRNVVHGDLAARNVLLADNDVVKICDFGLAREMYKDVYQKQKDKTDLLPVKWMAIESIRDYKFSTKSDVWSYGVVLWELFTLGNSPYPGMEPDAEFYQMLHDGFRMNKPEYASSDIYDLMNKCWDIIPENRPTFASIADDLGDMCDQSLREHYIALNEDCNRENSRMLEGREDYLMQMPVSDIVVRCSTPDDRAYVNVATENPNNDYLRPLPVNRDSEYVTVQPDPQPQPNNFFNNLAYQIVNPIIPSQDSSNHINLFSPRTSENQERFDFGGVELTDLSKCNNNPIKPNLPSQPSNTFREESIPEINGFSNGSYVPFNSDTSNNQDRDSNGLEVFDMKNIQNGFGKPNISRRKKNDSGVSSSSSGPGSDSESPRSSLKAHQPIHNGFVGTKNHDTLVENQNYFNSQSMLPN